MFLYKSGFRHFGFRSFLRVICLVERGLRILSKILQLICFKCHENNQIIFAALFSNVYCEQIHVHLTMMNILNTFGTILFHER